MWTIDPVAAIYRANQSFHEWTTPTAVLACGIAHHCPEFHNLGNQIREVTLTEGCRAADAFAETESFFAQWSEICPRWVPAIGQPIEPLETFLASEGFAPLHMTVMALQSWPELPRHPQVRMVPARAMREALRTFTTSDAGMIEPPLRGYLAYAMEQAMDSPTFDMHLAMVDGQVVGHGALLQAGPIGAVFALAVAPDWQRRGVGRTIMAYLLTLARRLDLKTVVLEVATTNAVAMRLYERCGFVAAGHRVEFNLISIRPGG